MAAQDTLNAMMDLAAQAKPDDTSHTLDPGDSLDYSPDLGIDTTHPDDEQEARPEITDDEVLRWIMACREEAYQARINRMYLNSRNQDAYMGLQDWSHKQKGQSTEFLPKVAVAAEQFAAFIKKALMQYGDWFQIEQSDNMKPFITDGQIRKLMKLMFDSLPDGPNSSKNLETVISDGAKAGLLESLIILKVYGRNVPYLKYAVEGGDNVVSFPSGSPATKTLKKTKENHWHLCVDLIRSEDYFPDPTGRGLYEIHEVERDYIDVLKMAKAGTYDLDAVMSIKDEDFSKPESITEKRRPQQRGQNYAIPPAKRRRTLITEFWGTIINDKGEEVADSLLATVANKKTLIRRPIDNPLWHGESPFVVAPLIRVPHSVWHKALYDNSSNLNFAINEMFNLMLDGGISAVWGIKQLRQDYLVDPAQVEDGIPQGITLTVKNEMPEGIKVLETVASADPGIMQAGTEIWEILDREFTQASLTNDISLGSLPQRQVKATEIVQANQSNDVTLSSISMDLEINLAEKLLRKSWLTMAQFMDDMSSPDIAMAIGPQASVLLAGLSTAERFILFANGASFKVNGLSATLAAAQDFQKLMAFFQACSQNPVLLRSFITKYSPDRVLAILIKQLNINPDDIAATGDQDLPQITQQIAMFAQMIGGQSPGNPAGSSPQPQPPGPSLSPPTGQTEGGNVAMTAGVNQQIQPLTGLGTTQ